ncbi:DEAD/DEAH box helicase [uncultured Methylophaga sp.]|uniref:DEAD/DEAH box helicase n=1 Tax=uncultured Methylophaga sp. TaxID=285271 RepID=UPI00260EF030|nr:DEAD/DEAH box helicase [uncultured Methylophaga sp.]
MTFSNLGLSDPILQAIADQGYNQPSPIQAKAIPAILKGGDVMAAAQTGTGKTAGFTLPILQRLSTGKPASANQARALILAPTRELAAQVADSIQTYGKHLPLRSSVVFGGVKINPQMMRLRKGADILVATPGRLLDLYQQNAIRFDQLEVLVLDEADRMLDMGFIHDIRKIINLLPKKRQNLLFSATFSKDIRNLAKQLVNNPVEISVSPANSTATSVKQWIVPVDKKQKSALLGHLINDSNWFQVLVFSRTKHGANKLTRQLEKVGLRAAAIHGNKSQGARTRALAEFKSGEVQVLVATDIAARGLDIDQLPHVINVDLPNVAEDYVHRIGRTGRAGASGEAVSLVSADESDQLFAIERLIGKTLQREFIEGFEPVHDVPASRLSQPKHPRHRHKPRAGHRDGQRSETAHSQKRRRQPRKAAGRGRG